MALSPTLSPTLSPKGALFDLDNTLVDRDAAFAAWLASLPMSEADLAVAVELDQSGYQPPQTVCSHIGACLGQSVIETWTAMREGIVKNISPAPVVRDVVESFAISMPIALVTNGGADNQRRKLRASGLADLFGDRVVISGELGVAKPAQAIFAHALALIDRRAGETIFVGDHPETDIDGARAAGLEPVWIARGRSRAPVSAAITVDSVVALPPLVLNQ